MGLRVHRPIFRAGENELWKLPGGVRETNGEWRFGGLIHHNQNHGRRPVGDEVTDYLPVCGLPERVCFYTFTPDRCTCRR